MRRRTDEFRCVDEAGNEFAIIERTNYESVGFDPSEVNGEKLIPGLKEYETEDGHLCNRVSEDEFVVFSGSGEIKVMRKK